MENSRGHKKKAFRLSSKLEQNVIEQQKSKQIAKLINDNRQQRLLSKLKNYHGKNMPVDYKNEYHFLEQWQNKDLNQSLNLNNLFEELGPLYMAYSIAFMILNVITVWIITTERYFHTRDLSTKGPAYQLVIFFILLEIIIRIYQTYKKNFICPEVKIILKNQYKNILLLIYFTVALAVDINHSIMNVIEVFVILTLCTKASKVYRHIKVMEFGLQYENYVKIFDLLFNVLIQAHIFAVLFYSASMINPQKNWVKSAGIQNQSIYIKYINSFYFACTTMLTIGYGDISPKNPEEKLITIFIEIVGVIAFGYLLNQMGHTLSKMRQANQNMQRDLQTIGKISKYYNLQPKLRNKARNFILDNQKNNEELKIEDENRVLMKLNEDLREQINLENSLNVLKSCVFFLCHWSKNMQTQIAQRLQKRVFAPNEKLISQNGKDRMYIIKKGKVNVSMNRYGHDQQHRKVLKVIDMQQKEKLEVSDNIYGYTHAFSNRPVKLEAVAKDFTSTYSINKEDLLYCVNQNKKDFQYYHEVKSRIDQSTFCEEWEAPKIRNIRQHYCPSYITLFKKLKYSSKHFRNKRRFHFRKDKNKFSLISPYYNVNRDRGATSEPQFISQATLVFDKTNKQFKEYESSQQSSINNEKNNDKNQSITSIKQIETEQQIKNLRARFLSILVEASQKKEQIYLLFQKPKQYTNFFHKNNLSNVLFLYQKENPIQNRCHSKKKCESLKKSRK